MNQPKQPDARISVDSDTDMAHGLRGRENHAYNALEAIKRRAKIDSTCFDLTRALGFAPQRPASAGRQAASRAHHEARTMQTYPQIYSHVDN